MRGVILVAEGEGYAGDGVGGVGKSLLHYALANLLLARIRRILVVAAPEQAPNLQRLLGDGGQWGVSLSYALAKNRGMLGAVLAGAEFIGGQCLAVARAEHILHGEGLEMRLRQAATLKKGARAFAAGLYFYDHTALNRALQLSHAGLARGQPASAAGIADLNQTYRQQGGFTAEVVGDALSSLKISAETTPAEAARCFQALEKRHRCPLLEPLAAATRAGFIAPPMR